MPRDRKTIALVLIVAFFGSLITVAGMQDRPVRRTPFPHAVHIENDLACTDCHEGAEEQDRATIPGADWCYECHEDPVETGSDAEKAFFSERDAGEGKLNLASELVFADLKFSHKVHIAKDAVCQDCHGDVEKGAFIRKGTPDFKHTCMDCHEMMEASVECTACHDSYRKDAAPESHKAAVFMKTHGSGVQKYFRSLPEGQCFFCHSAGECDQCHQENRPAGHDAPLFLRHHGDDLRFGHGDMTEAGCALCHDKGGCDACHQQRQPRSHNVSFKNRTHGMAARFERQTCQTCHRQTFCIQCHTTVEPLSHKGQFDSGFQFHCFSCHLPLSSSRCAVCHRQTAGHNSVPQPNDPTHLGATPNSCRVCHAPVPHADNGLDCTICH